MRAGRRRAGVAPLGHPAAQRPGDDGQEDVVGRAALGAPDPLEVPGVEVGGGQAPGAAGGCGERGGGAHRSRRPARTRRGPTPSARPTSPIRPSAMPAISRGSGSQERGRDGCAAPGGGAGAGDGGDLVEDPGPDGDRPHPVGQGVVQLDQDGEGPAVRSADQVHPPGRQLPARAAAPSVRRPGGWPGHEVGVGHDDPLDVPVHVEVLVHRPSLPPTGSRTSRTDMRRRGIAAARLPSSSRIRPGPTPGAGANTASAPRCIGWASDSRCQKARSSGARSSVLNGGLMSSKRRGRGQVLAVNRLRSVTVKHRHITYCYIGASVTGSCGIPRAGLQRVGLSAGRPFSGSG